MRTFFEQLPVDLVLIRENTEDLYAGVEFEAGKKETSQLIDFINGLPSDRKIQTSGDETGISIKPMSARIAAYGKMIFRVANEIGTSGMRNEGRSPAIDAMSPTLRTSSPNPPTPKIRSTDFSRLATIP